MSILSNRCLFSILIGLILASWRLLWYYFDFPIKYYNVEYTNITYFNNGVNALESKIIKIGAKQHWYSTEQILLKGKYIQLIIEKGFSIKLDKNIAYNIRYINKIICSLYLNPSKYYNKIIRMHFIERFNLSMNEEYTSVHLRVGDADNQPFKNYINKTIIRHIINMLKLYKRKVILLSDSIIIKKEIKNQIGKYIFTDNNLPCHSRNTECLNISMEDIMMMKNANNLILTRASTFSLFGSYFSKCDYEKILFIGSNYCHSNYFK